MRRLLVTSLLFSVISASVCGCSIEKKNTNTWVQNQHVNPSSLPSSVTSFVDVISKRYGENHPKIESAITDNREATFEPMYDLTIEGNFKLKKTKFKMFVMNVLTDGSQGILIVPNKFGPITVTK